MRSSGAVAVYIMSRIIMYLCENQFPKCHSFIDSFRTLAIIPARPPHTIRRLMSVADGVLVESFVVMSGSFAAANVIVEKE